MNIERLKIEDQQNWLGRIKSIPFIQFPADWKIQIIPPFGDAVARFKVELPDKRIKSIYLDYENVLGIYWGEDQEPAPYWEVYPHQGDVARCAKDDVETLLRYISEED